jgi:hypothetical protein
LIPLIRVLILLLDKINTCIFFINGKTLFLILEENKTNEDMIGIQSSINYSKYFLLIYHELKDFYIEYLKKIPKETKRISNDTYLLINSIDNIDIDNLCIRSNQMTLKDLFDRPVSLRILSYIETNFSFQTFGCEMLVKSLDKQHTEEFNTKYQKMTLMINKNLNHGSYILMNMTQNRLLIPIIYKTTDVSQNQILIALEFMFYSTLKLLNLRYQYYLHSINNIIKYWKFITINNNIYKKAILIIHKKILSKREQNLVFNLSFTSTNKSNSSNTGIRSH